MTATRATAKALQNYDAESTGRKPGERWITMNNALTRASHGLTLAEKRLVMLALSKIDSRKPPPQRSMHHLGVSRISAQDFAEAYQVSTDTAYDQLQSAGKNLRKRYISFFEPASKRSGKQLHPTIVEMNWVSVVRYQRGEGWIELTWVPELLPNLMGLSKQFTSYQLGQASALRSVYSWKLLELLMRFKSTGIAQYSIEDFCHSMDATAKQREDFGKIRTKIIEPAVKELREKDHWDIEWAGLKEGRKVTGLRFTFKRNPQQPLDFKETREAD